MSRRRFKIGEHPKYDKRYHHRKMTSGIISPQNVNSNVTDSMNTKKGLQSLLLEYKGTEENGTLTNRNGRNLPSALTQREAKVEQIVEQFEQMNLKRQAEGKLPLQEMPEKLSEQYYENVAELDIVQEEIDTLENLLSEFEEQAEKETDSRMLKSGPMGTGAGEPLWHIDYQSCELQDGILTIIEPDSPYHQMPVVAYRELVVKPYQEQIKQRMKRKQQEYKERLANGENVTAPRVSTPTIPKSRLPKRPSDKAIEQFMKENDIKPITVDEEAEETTDAE